MNSGSRTSWNKCLVPRAALGLVLASALPLEAGTLLVRSKSAKTPVASVLLFVPDALPAVPGSPTLMVQPLLGPNRELLPGGIFQIWVGRNDATPLADKAVVLTVPTDENANRLVSEGQRVSTTVIRTDSNGIAEVRLAAPDRPQDNEGESGGGPEE